MLFNTYLYFFKSNPTLKKTAENGKILAFADDTLIIAKDRKEAKATLKAFEEI